MNVNITEIDIVIRLFLSFLAGGIIGFERSSRRQVAGLRTHILISLGATCLMLLSIWLPRHMGSNADPGRIAAQVVSGMGFLGAGAIIRLGNNIKGLTTAASLWLVAAIGLAVGAGMYLAALTTEILAMVTLVSLNQLERKIFPEIKKIDLEINYNHSDEPNIESILAILKSFNIENQSMEIFQGKNERKTKINFTASIFNTVNISKLIKAIEANNDIDNVDIKENYNQ
jgi:putative Mg2+ transporter-C (MgtC) family protein